MKPEEKTFVRISNKDIFNKLCNVERHVIQTNGTVNAHSQSIKRLWWALGTIIGVAVTVFAAFQ